MAKGKAKPKAKPDPQPPQGGRHKLMQSALHLAATTRSWASVGLREVARHAGVNPNTFYRHFKDFDELGLALIQQLSGDLRRDLRARRQRIEPHGTFLTPERARTIVRETVVLVFDFVSEYRAAYVVGIRELHGGSPLLRKALRRVMDDLADDMAEDVLRLVPEGVLEEDSVRELAPMIIRQMSFLALDFVEHPEQRAALEHQAERFILMLFFGAAVAKNMPSWWE